MEKIEIKLLICFVVFLIVSITPAGATQLRTPIGKNTTDHIQKNQTLEQIIQNCQNEIDNLNQEMESEQLTMDQQIRELASITPWRFIRIMKKGNEISNTCNKIKQIEKRLEEVTSILEYSELQLENSEVIESDNRDATSNARDMANKLQASLNTSFHVNTYNGTLVMGDIVQYKDNKAYYRYITVKNITQNQVILEGKNHQKLILSQNETYNKISYILKPNTEIDSYTVVCAAYDIQLNKINKQLEYAYKKYDRAVRLDGTSLNLRCLGAAFLAFSAGILAMSIVFFCKTKWAMAFIMLAVSIFYGAIGGPLLGEGIHFEHRIGELRAEGNKLEDTANQDLDDLNNFLTFDSIRGPVANNMSLNTTIDKSLEGVFNATDADRDLTTAVLISGPRYGNLTINGTKFVYTPLKGYVGNDTFTYVVKDKTELISNIAFVNIEVRRNFEAQNLTRNLTMNMPLHIDMILNYNVVIVNEPEHGNVSVENSRYNYPRISYYPFKDYVGNDTFSYRLQSKDGMISDIGWINIVIKDWGHSNPLNG